MVAHALRRDVEAALPAGGHASQAAERDEGEGKDAAVGAQAVGAAVGDAVKQQVGGLEAVVHVARHPVVGRPRAGQAVFYRDAVKDAARKAAQVRRKGQVRLLLRQVGRARSGSRAEARVRGRGHGLRRPEVDVGRPDEVLVLHEELPNALGLPEGRPLGRVLGGSHHARSDVDDAHVGNLRAGRQRQPRAHRRPRPNLDARARADEVTQADPPLGGALAAHLLDDCQLGCAVGRRTRKARHLGRIQAQRVHAAPQKALLAVNQAPVKPPAPDERVELGWAKLRPLGAHQPHDVLAREAEVAPQPGLPRPRGALRKAAPQEPEVLVSRLVPCHVPSSVRKGRSLFLIVLAVKPFVALQGPDFPSREVLLTCLRQQVAGPRPKLRGGASCLTAKVTVTVSQGPWRRRAPSGRWASAAPSRKPATRGRA